MGPAPARQTAAPAPTHTTCMATTLCFVNCILCCASKTHSANTRAVIWSANGGVVSRQQKSMQLHPLHARLGDHYTTCARSQHSDQCHPLTWRKVELLLLLLLHHWLLLRRLLVCCLGFLRTVQLQQHRERLAEQCKAGEEGCKQTPLCTTTPTSNQHHCSSWARTALQRVAPYDCTGLNTIGPQIQQDWEKQPDLPPLQLQTSPGHTGHQSHPSVQLTNDVTAVGSHLSQLHQKQPSESCTEEAAIQKKGLPS